MTKLERRNIVDRQLPAKEVFASVSPETIISFFKSKGWEQITENALRKGNLEVVVSTVYPVRSTDEIMARLN